ncbi:pyridoxal-phosphate-dependent aminotransferase family protein [Aliarcobacter butzleri]|uniref:pyridoxal-phosphate-dependent aminotransferase family protein n=1 Tax=Aliarcobacter butzleri TaxID=28197 RepID=UPI001EDA29D0|nr:aminotransferase class V-fold PLP-dependent enzyme [Aliarcobacter butzleri]MCG3675152.1 aminotransferase class V-fold PLP-dependent enzyme [Aliarcobacter butzleri]MCG3683710.1 aminotransferase class V-fold PLP-dependent enzyme [Aliarcobacter butzleri]MCG3688106.1 aminotransferase class V-fold PLP-dependent enzyme [Aliarcobacter butzleri]MCG3697873.1 aminotransferase class V-fold PLP-dependent enzyme [Aliarcobacter butzleri]MCG3699887.1 aminotransferase class V-fold PLP-dependent enzyme [Ali
MNKQYIFAPGPVPMSKKILKIGSKQLPYFRNEYFSKIVLECKKDLLTLTNAPKDSEVIFMTSSGTGAMEAVIMNLLSKDDNAIIINGGGFGQRFVDICNTHNIPNFDIKINKDENINFEGLSFFHANTFIVNAHETTIGKLYNLNKIGQFCKKNNLLNIVDAISTFVCDEIDMKKQHIDALIISSNKGLALPPGLGIVVLSPKAILKLQEINSIYFNFKSYITDIQRGQTPFTPAISIILQLNKRLKELRKQTIVKANKKTKKLANYFRKNIKDLPFEFYVKNMPNAMTTLTPTDGKLATQIIEEFEERYNIILTPSGGDLKEKLIRVSHMGNMNKKYVDVLINALKQYYRKI